MPKLKLVLKLCVSALLLYAAVSLVDFENLTHAAGNVAPEWIFLAFVVFCVMTIFDSMQFVGVVRSLDTALTFKTSLLITLVGRFFSVFTPAMVGSDVYRAIAMANRGSTTLSAIGFAAISRILALMSLTPVLIAGAPLLIYYTETLYIASGYILVDLTVLTLTYLLLFSVRGRRNAILRWATNVQPIAKIMQGTEKLRFVTLRSTAAPKLWAFAVLQHVLRVVVLWAIARSFAIEASFLAFFAFVPVSLLIAMIPISLGSWGLREVSLIYALGLVGVDAEAAFLTSVAFGLIGFPLSLLGGLLWVLTGQPVNQTAQQHR